MDRFFLLFVIAFRNLRSHRLKTAVVTAIVALGTFIIVFGLAMLGSMEAAMERSVTASITGHIQVWSDASDDKLTLINLGTEVPDLGELPNFGEVEEKLLAVDGVKAVVPMAIGTAASFARSDVDIALERLREAVDAGSADEMGVATAQVRRLAATLVEGYQNEAAITERNELLDQKLEVARKVNSDAFWSDFAADHTAGLQYLDTTFAPLAPEGQPLYIEYLATDPHQFAQVFDRLKVVDGAMIPEGRRGLMLSNRFYERMVKNPVAREFDQMEEKVAAGQSLESNPALASRVNWMSRQQAKLALQLDRAEGEALRPKLLESLGKKDGTLLELLAEFLKLDDSNFAERRAFFDAEIAPRIKLHEMVPGDVVVLQAFTSNGYLKSVTVPFHGTFEFKGLETSSIAHGREILDLVTYRELYGKMSATQKAELDEIRDSAGVEEVSRESAEDALFGDDAGPLESETEAAAIEDSIPQQLGAAAGLDDRVYPPEEMRDGLATNVAVMLEDPERIDETIATINAIDGFQATNWRVAAGIVGQFVLVITGVLSVAILVIFLLAMLIINNSMLMAMMERISEIGTLRAIGGQRDEILVMVLLETALITFFAGLIGGGAAVALVLWLGTVGIPAPSGIVVFLFGGDRLYPFVTAGNLGVAITAVSAVTLVSTLYPARLATRVQPIVAMRGN